MLLARDFFAITLKTMFLVLFEAILGIKNFIIYLQYIGASLRDAEKSGRIRVFCTITPGWKPGVKDGAPLQGADTKKT